MAAEVLARELQLDLYRIDLSAVVSKYIGETEKNLKQVFDAAEEGGVLLLFDEADALFGKRSEVKDSHDRYANIEVGYLLQRMEAYQGLAILTTNLKSALDTAFQRRLRFTVNFPFPDAAQREAIWSSVFPARDADRGSGLPEARAAQRDGRKHPQHRAECRVPGRGVGHAGAMAHVLHGRPAGGAEDRAPAVRSGDPGVGMSRIRVNIDRLVLNGIAAARRKGAGGWPASRNWRECWPTAARAEWARSHRTPVLRLGQVPLESGPSGGRKFGKSMARAIGRGLKP